MSVEHWKSSGKSHNDRTLYALDDQAAEVRILLDGDAWLLARLEGDIVNFAVFEFFSSNIDGTVSEYTMLLNGSGIAGALRECRHIWWGEDGDDGYTSYLDFQTVEAALRELRQWFDG